MRWDSEQEGKDQASLTRKRDERKLVYTIARGVPLGFYLRWCKGYNFSPSPEKNQGERKRSLAESHRVRKKEMTKMNLSPVAILRNTEP